MKIYEKYFAKEILKSFLFSLVIFNLLFILIKLSEMIEKIIEGKLTILGALKLLIYLIPSLSIFTLPLSFLGAVLFTFSQFSATNEIIALKSCGLSPLKLSKIPFIIGVGVFLLSIFNNIYVLPLSSKLFYKEFNQIIKKAAANSLSKNTFNNFLSSLIIYFEDKKGEYLDNVLIYDFRKAPPSIIVSNKGILGINKDMISIKLNDGQIHLKKKNKEYSLIKFGSYAINFNLNTLLQDLPLKLKDKECSIELLKERIEKNKKIKNYSKVNYLKTELYKRFAIPFSSIVFVFFGVIFGIKNTRNPKSYSFIAIIFIIFNYYLVFILMGYLVKNKILSPFLAAWMPDFIFLLIGGILFYYVNKEKIKL